MFNFHNTLKAIILNIIWIIVINLVNECKSDVKTWNSNFDLKDPKNWKQRRIPCSADRIIFSENTVIYLNQEIKAKEIVSLIK